MKDSLNMDPRPFCMEIGAWHVGPDWRKLGRPPSLRVWGPWLVRSGHSVGVDSPSTCPV